VDHGGLHPDLCKVTIKKERASPYDVFRRISGELRGLELSAEIRHLNF
jgi:hypothetical protein